MGEPTLAASLAHYRRMERDARSAGNLAQAEQWRALAAEVDAYLARDPDVVQAAPVEDVADTHDSLF